MTVTNPTVPEAVTNVGDYTYYGGHTVSGVAPAGDSVAPAAAVITGTGFVAGGTYTVTFGGVAGTVGVVTATSISVTPPAHAPGVVDMQ